MYYPCNFLHSYTTTPQRELLASFVSSITLSIWFVPGTVFGPSVSRNEDSSQFVYILYVCCVCQSFRSCINTFFFLLDNDCVTIFSELHITSLVKGLDAGHVLFVVFSLSVTTCPVSFWQTHLGQRLGFIDLSITAHLWLKGVWHWTKGSLLYLAFKSLWFVFKAVLLWWLLKKWLTWQALGWLPLRRRNLGV